VCKKHVGTRGGVRDEGGKVRWMTGCRPVGSAKEVLKVGLLGRG
jgi:hypothetical protein